MNACVYDLMYVCICLCMYVCMYDQVCVGVFIHGCFAADWTGGLRWIVLSPSAVVVRLQYLAEGCGGAAREHAYAYGCTRVHVVGRGIAN